MVMSVSWWWSSQVVGVVVAAEGQFSRNCQRVGKKGRRDDLQVQTTLVGSLHEALASETLYSFPPVPLINWRQQRRYLV
jgi:hypothetical protein